MDSVKNIHPFRKKNNIEFNKIKSYENYQRILKKYLLLLV